MPREEVLTQMYAKKHRSRERMKNSTALSEEEHDRNGAAEAWPDARWAVIDERLDDTQYIEWRPVGALASLSDSLHQRKKKVRSLSTTSRRSHLPKELAGATGEAQFLFCSFLYPFQSKKQKNVRFISLTLERNSFVRFLTQSCACVSTR